MDSSAARPAESVRDGALRFDAAVPNVSSTAPTPPLLGWYGDDFTGATDTLSALAQAHLRALLFMGVPAPRHLAAAGPLDAIGIAGAARSMTPDAMRAELEPVGRFFAATKVPVLHYKVCSTFDSAPTVGSIGVAIATLRPHVANAFVPIVGGQPNIGRYCVYSNLFAAAGIGGAVHRIDRHPTMSRHPVTPMHEADLRRHLAAQGLPDVGAIHYPVYERNDTAQDAWLDAELARIAPQSGNDIRAVLFDVAHAAHLAPVGRLLWTRAQQQRLLAVGGSSVVQALAACRPQRDVAADFVPPRMKAARGPVFALSGSMSPVTARQIDAATAFERMPVDASRLATEPGYMEALLEHVATALGGQRNVLAYVDAPRNSAAPTVAATEVAQATARLAAQVVHRMARSAPLRRVGIAGGDTSSHVAQALGLWGLSYAATVEPGVTLSRAHSDDPTLDGLELMLKGGQMGAADLFDRLVRGD